MRYKRIIIAIVLSFFATGIMGYISMATPIGPWIETTLVLCAMLLFSFSSRSISTADFNNSLGLTTAAGGISGILATAFGFSFPALYFIDPTLFASWMSKPLYFSFILTGLALAGGSFGLLVAALFQEQLLIKQAMAFPIGELIHKTITAHNQLRKAFQLAFGFIITFFALYAQKCTSFIASCFTIIKGLQVSIFTIPCIAVPIDQLPMYLAVGFITGHLIAVPLVVGFLIKIFLLDPLHYIYIHPQLTVHKIFFSHFANTSISSMDFMLAFCSGMVLYGACISFLALPNMLKKMMKNKENLTNKKALLLKWPIFFGNNFPWTQAIIALIINSVFLTYWNFSFGVQLYLFFFTFIWSYQMLVIAGKIGIAPLGRFATFVMVPAMLFFNLNPAQIIFIATFVEIAGGVACDALFGRKMALLTGIDNKKIILYQWLGLLVSACAVGIIFWLFIYHFGLGMQEGALAVNKAASRALLINVKSFDFYVLILGCIFGYLIKYTHINPMLILGGILMPPGISLMLIIGGFAAYITKNKEDYYPFWSGVFTADSLWMLLKVLFKIPCL